MCLRVLSMGLDIEEYRNKNIEIKFRYLYHNICDIVFEQD